MINVAGREIPEIEYDPGWEGWRLYTLRYLLGSKVPAGFLANYIEHNGIEMIDRYNRVVLADEAGTAQALDAIAGMVDWERGKEVVFPGKDWCSDGLYKVQEESKDKSQGRFSHIRETPSPLEWTEDKFSDYDRFGWLDISPLSKWQDSQAEMHECPSASGLEELSPKHRKSHLIVIAALCKKAGVTANSRGLPIELQEIAQRLGLSLGDDTIRKILRDVQDLTC